ncbi:MAG: putative metal-binding motif-containing protein [Alphaproteobacteria bacterium]|nr:putative metal-binding motif-containing protein [Alphaproteobacteria bacterium]
MPLIPCPACACHVREAACSCPHCGATLKVCQRGYVKTAAAALMGFAAMSAGCVGQPKYGMPDTAIDSVVEDADGDGFTVAAGDCDDDNADVHPDAEETAGDGVDSNCDGSDDT